MRWQMRQESPPVVAAADIRAPQAGTAADADDALEAAAEADSAASAHPSAHGVKNS